jgi:hypothetical protein
MNTCIIRILYWLLAGQTGYAGGIPGNPAYLWLRHSVLCCAPVLYRALRRLWLPSLTQAHPTRDLWRWPPWAVASIVTFLCGLPRSLADQISSCKEEDHASCIAWHLASGIWHLRLLASDVACGLIEMCSTEASCVSLIPGPCMPHHRTVVAGIHALHPETEPGG